MITRTRNRLRTSGEEGIALVVAVLVLGLVSIMAASAIYYTTSSQQDAASKKSGQTAYALAQAALSNATTQLTSHYYNSDGKPYDNTTSLSSQATSWAPSGSQQSPSSTAACAAGTTCMQWSAVLNCPSGVSCPGGSTIGVSGITRAKWHLTANGTVPNPSGPGNLTRTITIDVPVQAPPAKAPAPDIFKIVYSGKSSSGCDFTTGQGVTLAAPVYIVGNYCSTSNGGIEAGPQDTGSLTVGGWTNLSGNGAHVGTTTTPLKSVRIGKSCDGTQSATTCSLTQPAGKTYYVNPNSKITSAGPNGTPDFPAPPSINWPQVKTDRGVWSCTGGHSLTASSFDLTGTAYTCTTESGSLSWDGSSQLQVQGNVYVDGDLITDNNAQLTYTGLGSIYAGGKVTFGNNTAICVGSFSNHLCPNGPTWPAAYPVDQNMLLILAQGVIHNESNLSFEGGVYSQSTIDFGGGQSNVYGPMVTPDQIIPGQQAVQGFPTMLELYTSAPGTPQPYWTLGTPENGTF